MHHVAIMKKSRWLIDKILAWEKTIESRRYQHKRPPYDKIKRWDIIFFKDSPGMVSATAEVAKVEQHEQLTPAKTKKILAAHGHQKLWTQKMQKEFNAHIAGKHYVVLVHLRKAKEIKPFSINKKGFGVMASRLSTKHIKHLQKKV